ncbi:structural maintenance of chromosomes protein 6 [Electrophorus electricus]|uniref:structural maintenance of chromosomes protein 6 n=1 Tax=Electrophorus electricus TaxID=8005 RepID=UPI0015D04837|nr:structural maintenance of chromosomes protein 6 [Electrophorus electricus]
MSKRKNNQILEVPSKRVRLSQPEPPDDEEERICSIQDSSDLRTSHCASGEVGIIENIFLRNFMCHSLLGPFTFGPNVNFVIGNNGSGKSAILTALIVGLGGKAQTTNRGSSLKGFIKEGESSAQISITMRNRGQDAYKPEVFGESITIDLRISSEGLRTYKFMSKTGQPVPYKKEELVSILDHFNIQVDNPISILTQEMSKHFLHSKGEGDKYKFFMKATQLEQMKEDYSYIMETKAMTQNTVQKHEEILQEMRLKFKEKEERYKNLASLDEMLQKLGELKGQMAWALVTEMEREIKNMREKIAGEEKSTIKYDQKVEEWKEKVAEAEQKYKEFHDQLESVNQRLKQLQPKCTQLKNEVQERCRVFRVAEARLHRHTTNLRDLERDKDQLTNRISELKYSITQSSAVSSQSRREQMNRLQTELDALNFKESTLAQQIEQFQQAYNSAKDKLNKMRLEVQDLHRALESKRRELTTLEGSRIGGLRRFGEKMPALIAAIEEANHRGHFRVKPVGPLGYCIRLRDAELCLAVESCLKSLLFAFCCDNYMDEKVLQLLMSKAFSQERRPQIIVSEFTDTLYDISTRAVRHPQYPTVLQALDIDNPVVANCLIDMRGIETILLIKNNKDARRVMQRGCPPCNCKEAFTREGDQVFNNRYYSSEQQRALYLSHDVEKEIRNLQAALQTQQRNHQDFAQNIGQVEDQVHQNEVLFKRALTDHKRVKDQCRKLHLQMSDLQNVEEPQSEDLKPLEEELEELSDKLTVSREEYEMEKQQMLTLKSGFEEVELQYRQHKDDINSLAEEADPIKEELSKSDQVVEKSKHNKKHYEEKRKEHLSHIQDLKKSLGDKEHEIENSITKALEICPERSDVRRTAKSLDSEISRLKLKISTQQDQHGDRDTILRQYQDALQSYNGAALQVKGLKSFITLLGNIMNKRHNIYTEMRRYLSVRCKYYFDSMLSQRGYTGKMTFSHKDETLSISVQPGENAKAALSDMRSLSGGERSFSTVCFVLSLWAIAEAPFRCLDEFDVYMDMVNRRISMDMMLKIAASQRYRQFIFLTPQSMSSLPPNNLTHILRLNDPDRNQSTLPFGQP